MKTDHELELLEQASWAGHTPAGLIHRLERSSPYLPVRHSARFGGVGAAPSVGSIGDSNDNAPPDAIIGLGKPQVVQRLVAHRGCDAVQQATRR